MNAKPAVVKALAFLADTFPTLDATVERAVAWSAILGHYSEDQLMRAAVGVAKTHRFGAPSPALLVEQIEGRIETIRVPVLDLWNRAILNDNGEPRTEARQVRVFPDGRQEPIALPKHEDGDWREGPASLAEGIAALLDPQT